MVISLEKNSALVINIEGMIPENCQFFVDEINRGGLVNLVYGIYALVWDTYLQIMENSEAKSFFYHSKNASKLFF